MASGSGLQVTIGGGAHMARHTRRGTRARVNCMPPCQTPTPHDMRPAGPVQPINLGEGPLGILQRRPGASLAGRPARLAQRGIQSCAHGSFGSGQGSQLGRGGADHERNGQVGVACAALLGVRGAPRAWLCDVLPVLDSCHPLTRARRQPGARGSVLEAQVALIPRLEDPQSLGLATRAAAPTRCVLRQLPPRVSALSSAAKRNQYQPIAPLNGSSSDAHRVCGRLSGAALHR